MNNLNQSSTWLVLEKYYSYASTKCFTMYVCLHVAQEYSQKYRKSFHLMRKVQHRYIHITYNIHVYEKYTINHINFSSLSLLNKRRQKLWKFTCLPLVLCTFNIYHKCLTIQGVQDQNLPKEMAISLKGSISDHTFVKPKFVSGKNNFFGKFWFLKTCKNLENFTKSSNFSLALGRVWTQDL